MNSKDCRLVIYISLPIISLTWEVEESQIAVGCKDNMKNLVDQKVSPHQESPGRVPPHKEF